MNLDKQEYKEKIVQLLEGIAIKRLRRIWFFINGMIGGVADDK